MESFFKKEPTKNNASFFAKSPNISVYDALKNSYASRDKQSDFGKDQGYEFDNDLSDDNQQIYYNPNQKKLLVSVTGSHNAKDYLTDVALMTGQIKNTDRYKKTQQAISKAYDKYKPEESVGVGHSLGGSVLQYASPKDMKIITYNKGATIGQKTRSNETALRTQGDLASLLVGGSSSVNTLKNKNKISKSSVKNILESHKVDNLKNKNLLI